MGVTLMNLAEGDSIVAVARGGESSDDEGDADETGESIPSDDVESVAEVDVIVAAEAADPEATE